MRRKVMTIIGLIILWSVLVIAVVLAEAFWFARPAVQPGNLTAIETHLVCKLSQASDRELGSAALILIQDDKVATTHQFGIANAETKAPVKLDQTLDQLASVSKLVTAWGVMKLVEDGRLALDQLVSRYLIRLRHRFTQRLRTWLAASGLYPTESKPPRVGKVLGMVA